MKLPLRRLRSVSRRLLSALLVAIVLVSVRQFLTMFIQYPISSTLLPHPPSSHCTSDLLSKPRLVADQKKDGGEQITCQKILTGFGNETFYSAAKRIMTSQPTTFLGDDQFVSLTADCAEFKRRRGYHTSPLNEEEEQFPIAYNIIMHRHIEQVEKLLRAIYRPQNVYCVHIDLNSPPEVHAGMTSLARCFNNVFIASKLEYIVYAGFSRLQADINCMRDHVTRDGRWRYLINVAGEAFPLRTNAEIVKILKIYNGANDIEGIYGKRIIRGRFLNEYEELHVNTSKRRIQKTGKQNPPIPHNIDFVRGSAYGIFSRAFVEFLLTDVKARDLLQWARRTYTPDEFYWATLHHTYRNPHLHTPGAYSGIPDGKPWLAVHATWFDGKQICLGKWRHGVCMFGISDLPVLIKREALFANKFLLDFEPLSYECMEAWIEYKSVCPPPFNDTYYRNLPFIIK